MKKSESNVIKLYAYLNDYLSKYNYLPSVRDMAKFLGVKSTSTISYYLNMLESEGKIRRNKHKSRALEIVGNYDMGIEYNNIPLLGSISAGDPAYAYENKENSYNIPKNLFYGEDLFMLKVKGESMINAHIDEGDMVVIKKQNTANNGQIVAAMSGDDATIKRFFKEEGYYRLQPENDYMEPIICENIEILGVVVGVIRKI